MKTRNAITFVAIIGTALLAGCYTGPSVKISRAEFKASVFNKTPEQVLAVRGSPLTTFDADKYNDEHWCYDRLTVHPVTGTLDMASCIYFQEGRVALFKFI